MIFFLQTDLQPVAKGVTEVARGIGDFGAMAILTATFVLLSVLMWIAIFRWFKGLMDDTVKRNGEIMESLIHKNDEQTRLLTMLVENGRPATSLQLKSIASVVFDLAIEKVCGIVKKIREENHIDDKERTRRKIRAQLTNLHKARNTKLDTTTYRGKPLGSYASQEWIDWVAEVVEQEVYETEFNNSRLYTNVRTVYDKISNDFYEKLDIY